MSRLIVFGIFVLFLTGFAITGDSNEQGAPDRFPVLEGPYFGLKPPGLKPELFAPGIVTTAMYTRDTAITPDGKEIYFCAAVGGYATILVTREVNGRWTRPEVAPHMENPDRMNWEPCISPDGKKFFFLSYLSDTGDGKTAGNQDIWVMDRTDRGWGKPYNLGPPVNTEKSEFFPSVTRDGTLYFSRAEKGSLISYIYLSRLKNGKYTEPEKLPARVNSGESQYNAFVSPDEGYLIVPVSGREDSYGGTDYYIVFRDAEDNWSEPVNMGDTVNTPDGGEYSPYVSPDGKYFFFMSSRTQPDEEKPAKLSYGFFRMLYNKPQNGNSDIYWMDASIIENLRPKKEFK